MQLVYCQVAANINNFFSGLNCRRAVTENEIKTIFIRLIMKLVVIFITHCAFVARWYKNILRISDLHNICYNIILGFFFKELSVACDMYFIFTCIKNFLFRI